jgi:hypothetical protein
LETTKIASILPWQNIKISTDDSLTLEIKKSQCPFPLLAKQELQILNELDYTIIYTDASRHIEGETGVGIYISIDDKTS